MSKRHSSLDIYQELVKKRLNSPLGYLLLALFSLLFVAILSILGEVGGIIILSIIIGGPILVACLINPTFGYFLALTYAFFMFVFAKLGINLPLGLGYDLIFYVCLGGILLKEIVAERSDWKELKNPIFIVLYLWSLYLVLQVLNPNAISTLGYSYAMRALITKFCILFVGVYVLRSLDIVKKFTQLWLSLALLAALYSFKQEFIGFFDFEEAWVMADEGRYRLIFVWGRFRKWSFLSDVNTFGLLMAFSSIFCLILMLGPYRMRNKLLLGFSGICMLLGMTFSGTRTAYAMIPAGFSLYFIMTLKDVKTWILGGVIVLSFLVVVFGPFYGSNMNRLRSLFNADEDPSMNVRDANRNRIQPYLLAHPIGGGLTTTGLAGVEYSRGHPLAGFPPDSGYLETALETGWIGLILEMGFLITVLIVGVRNYYRCQNPVIRNLYAAYLAAFFALTVANYGQNALSQKPIGLIVYTVFLLMFKLREMDFANPPPKSDIHG